MGGCSPFVDNNSFPQASTVTYSSMLCDPAAWAAALTECALNAACPQIEGSFGHGRSGQKSNYRNGPFARASVCHDSTWREISRPRAIHNLQVDRPWKNRSRQGWEADPAQG